jgi:hypothetical protein
MKPATGPWSARRVLVTLLVLAVGLVAMSIVQRDRALQLQHQEARERAKLYAAAVFRSALAPEDITTPLPDDRREELAERVRRFVLIAPTVARVRLWTPDGTLLFSTDPVEKPGETREDPPIGNASGGRVESRLAVEKLSSTDGSDRPATPLFQTFAPLRIRGSADVVGAVEIEEFAVELEERAAGPWWILQAGASGATVLLALLALVSVARGTRRQASAGHSRPAADRRPPRKRRKAGSEEGDASALRERLERATARAKAAEGLLARGSDLSAVREQLSAAARQVDEAVERERMAEGRANEAEERARAAAVMAAAAEQRIDVLEAKLQESTSAGGETVEAPELTELQDQLAEARKRADEMEQRAVDAESRLPVTDPLHGPAEENLQGLEERMVSIEARAAEAESLVRSFEAQAAEGGSRFRQRLALTAARKRGASVPPAGRETEPEMDLRTAISRGLRGPLTRASGLTLSLQRTIDSGEGKAALRQLSASLRRLDQLAADLHDAHRIVDGSLPLNRRRTDLAALMTATLEDATYLEDRLVRLDAGKVYARVDPVRARQIVEGMLDAAWERTRSGAGIVVRVRGTDAGALVSVEDDNRSPATIGREMSLAIRLAEMHGTEITVDGSSFRVVFPKG